MTPDQPNRLPERPEARRVIVVLTRSDWEWITYGPGKRGLKIEPGAHLLSVDSLWQPDSEVERELQTQGLLVPGATLIQSPYESSEYVPEDEAIQHFHRQKLTLVTELLQILGATSIQSELKTYEMELAKAQGRLSLGRRAGRANILDAQASLQRLASEELKRSLSIKDTYPKHAGNPDEARVFTKLHGIRDPEIVQLISARQKANAILSRKVIVTYQRKGDANLKLASSLKIPTLNLGGSFDSSSEIVESISLTLDVKF